ncbi:8-oxo-dGTP pyrophosphatase MutT (NUDIX family) [Rhizobium laguerreae]|uniref:8-oxo-dGTP pyrophosphatase MutT (NUDIX family) n=1 Tax=Rhizobium laguerreae TaxID=1076926 RepID=A0ABR6GJ03_9HYPH|nr:NUDIX domain-containing protein [Rhizobium laguerreae]MBB3166275.1 8-oxo-dGTP pyrophosphatase MutT (NUDIX family) [Rhizobium laguerreae]
MIEKALIYATNSRGILVFDEPDFPEAPLQVPGGTVEEGEPVIDAARREFGEETGLVDRTGFRLLGDSHRTFERDGKLHNLHRTYFHLSLEDGLPDTWDHFDDHTVWWWGTNPFSIFLDRHRIGTGTSRSWLGGDA